MDIAKLLDDCSTLENVITLLINGNATKEAKLTEFKSCIYHQSKHNLDKLVQIETKLKDELSELYQKKSDLDEEIQHNIVINGKLNELVVIANSSSDENNIVNAKLYHDINEQIQDYEQIKVSFKNLKDIIADQSVKVPEESEEIIRNSQKFRREIEKNDRTIRLLEQQNKFAEQQFDLILNQIPWKPMSEDRLSEICSSENQSIRNIGSCLKLQSAQMKDLNDSLIKKKEQKLKILDNLSSQLDEFVRKREEALMMNLL